LLQFGVAERFNVITGDFFRSVPSGADLYLLKHIIHDWDDEQSDTILKNCQSAMQVTSRLLLVERVMPETIEATQKHRRMAMLDSNMLVMSGGQERTEHQYRSLLSGAGMSVLQTIPVPDADISIIDSTAAD
jgi:O-methyltransferase domain